MPPSCALLGDLQSVHGLRCYDNISRTRNVSERSVLALCLVCKLVICTFGCLYRRGSVYAVGWTVLMSWSVTPLSLSHRCHCHTGVTVTQVSLSRRCHCHVGVTVTQVSLSRSCHCDTGVTVTQVSLSHRCHCHVGVTVTELLLSQSCHCHTGVTVT